MNRFIRPIFGLLLLPILFVDASLAADFSATSHPAPKTLFNSQALTLVIRRPFSIIPQQGIDQARSESAQLSQNKRHFWISFLSMGSLMAFSFWRVQVTVWRPRAHWYYFFSLKTWLGKLDQQLTGGWLRWLETSWFNDALYPLGMLACVYVPYSIIQMAKLLTEQSFGNLFGEAPRFVEPTLWEDHQRRSKIFMGTSLTLILIWAWIEEVTNMVRGYRFDKWDLDAVFFGFVVGFYVMKRLSYPVFTQSPYYFSQNMKPEDRHDLLEFLIGMFTVSMGIFFTWHMGTVTLTNAWSHLWFQAIVLAVHWRFLNRYRDPSPLLFLSDFMREKDQDMPSPTPTEELIDRPQWLNGHEAAGLLSGQNLGVSLGLLFSTQQRHLAAA